jgi:hypothetical protein
MRITFGKVKKTLAILLAVFFIVSVTVAAASAKSDPKNDKDKIRTIAVVTANGGPGGYANGGIVVISPSSKATSLAISKAKSYNDEAESGNAESDEAESGYNSANYNTVHANGGYANGGDGGSISLGFVGDHVGWDGAVGSNNANDDSSISNS